MTTKSQYIVKYEFAQTVNTKNINPAIKSKDFEQQNIAQINKQITVDKQSKTKGIQYYQLGQKARIAAKLKD